MSLVMFVEVRGVLPPTEDALVYVNAMAVNLVRPSTAELTELQMDHGERILVRGDVEAVVLSLESGW